MAPSPEQSDHASAEERITLAQSAIGNNKWSGENLLFFGDRFNGACPRLF